MDRCKATLSGLNGGALDTAIFVNEHPLIEGIRSAGFIGFRCLACGLAVELDLETNRFTQQVAQS